MTSMHLPSRIHKGKCAGDGFLNFIHFLRNHKEKIRRKRKFFTNKVYPLRNHANPPEAEIWTSIANPAGQQEGILFDCALGRPVLILTFERGNALCILLVHSVESLDDYLLTWDNV